VFCKSKKNCGGNSVFYTAFADKNGCSLPYASAKKTEKQPPLPGEILNCSEKRENCLTNIILKRYSMN
jgi:hypothetical protein